MADSDKDKQISRKGLIGSFPHHFVKEITPFEEIYYKYVDGLLAYGLGLNFDEDTVKDVIHDIFCKFYIENRELKNIDNIKPYLFKSLRNKLYTLHKTRPESININANEMHFSIKVTVLDKLIEQEEQIQIQTEIEKYLNILTQRQREAIYLRYIQGLDYDEISTLLDMTPHGVRKLVSRAIIRMRQNHLPLYLIVVSLQLPF